MKKTYIIDGYNLLHSSPDLKRTSAAFGIERARRDLLAAIGAFARDRAAECIVIFDGVATESMPGVRVVSSRNRSADDLIREHARIARRSLVVVSSDLEIVHTARTNLASVVASKAFAAELSLAQGGAVEGADRGDARPHRLEELRERSEKPPASDDDIDEWKRLFGV